MMEANKGPRPQTDSPPVFYCRKVSLAHSLTLPAAARLHTLCAEGPQRYDEAKKKKKFLSELWNAFWNVSYF